MLKENRFKVIVFLMAILNIAGLCFSSQVEYIRSEIPDIDIPSYKGDRYEAEIPDTFDIQKRIELAVNGVTGPTDPNLDYELYWWVNFFSEPAIMIHTFSDQCQLKFFESLPLMRLASGSKLNLEVERVWQKVILKSLGPDGLFYTPIEGRRPWAWEGKAWANKVWRADGTYLEPGDPAIKQWSSPFTTGRVLSALCVYYMYDSNKIWKDAIIKMVDRLNELAIDKGDWGYIPEGSFEPNAKVDLSKAEMPTGILAIEAGNGRIIQSLVQAYRATNYEPALKLAGKLTNFSRHHSGCFDSIGRFRISATEQSWSHEDNKVVSPFGGHFHSRSLALLAIAEYGLAVQDKELLEFVKKSFEWAQSKGSEMIGFFPEFLTPGYPSAEACEIADMIAIALKLSSAGVGDYWDDADRWIRNHFAESQLTSIKCLPNLPKRDRGPLRPNESAHKVAERNLGAFAGWSTGNEWAVYNGKDSLGRGIMHCCTGNATRSLYYIWDSILDYDNCSLKVNLLMNRASAWADINSHIPYTGRVDIKIKKPLKSLMLRVPEWIENNSKELKITVNGKEREPRWNKRYVDAGSVTEGDNVKLVFPIFLRRTTETLGKVNYDILLKGNSVVKVEPAGKYCPLYQREYFKSDYAPVTKASRFVGEKLIEY